MNFLETPTPGLVLNNPPQKEEELQTQICFIDKLRSLGVLKEVPENDQIQNTYLLFPKSGQLGQYRCIADMNIES